MTSTTDTNTTATDRQPGTIREQLDRFTRHAALLLDRDGETDAARELAQDALLLAGRIDLDLNPGTVTEAADSVDRALSDAASLAPVVIEQRHRHAEALEAYSRMVDQLMSARINLSGHDSRRA